LTINLPELNDIIASLIFSSQHCFIHSRSHIATHLVLLVRVTSLKKPKSPLFQIESG